jgi:hypothetical protein
MSSGQGRRGGSSRAWLLCVVAMFVSVKYRFIRQPCYARIEQYWSHAGYMGPSKPMKLTNCLDETYQMLQLLSKWRLGGRMRLTCGIEEARRSCWDLDSLQEHWSDFHSARSLWKVAMCGLLAYLVCIKFSPAGCISVAIVVPCSKEHHLSRCVDA